MNCIPIWSSREGKWGTEPSPGTRDASDSEGDSNEAELCTPLLQLVLTLFE